MISNGVIKINDSRYRVYVQYQDGIEHVGDYNDQESAETEWARAFEAWNGIKKAATEAPLYEWVAPVHIGTIKRVR